VVPGAPAGRSTGAPPVYNPRTTRRFHVIPSASPRIIMPRPHYFLPTLDNVRVRDRGNTPHWEMPNAIYSITFRLHDSLPTGAMDRIAREREARECRAITTMERMHIRRAYERDLDEHLDRSTGECTLADPHIAQVMVETLQFFRDRYELFAWCVMPNHVHVVMQVRGEQSLARILHSWKSYTAKRANEILGRQGTFWQREYFDRIVRDEEDLRGTIEYVVKNPEKAGLRDWPWVWRTGEAPV
jgi:REP element-mobilizing transposase RayT